MLAVSFRAGQNCVVSDGTVDRVLPMYTLVISIKAVSSATRFRSRLIVQVNIFVSKQKALTIPRGPKWLTVYFILIVSNMLLNRNSVLTNVVRLTSVLSLCTSAGS